MCHLSFREVLSETIGIGPSQTISLLELARALMLENSGNMAVYGPPSIQTIIKLLRLPPPSIENFEADPTRIEPGHESILRWRTENCRYSCRVRLYETRTGELVDDGDGYPTGGERVSPSSSTSYRLTVSFYGKPNVSKEVTVDVHEPPEPPRGHAKILLQNMHTDRRTVYVWIFDRTTQLWFDKGSLGYQLSMTISLEDDHTHDLICVDPGLIGCNGANDPNTGACRRLWVPNIVGDDEGGMLTVTVS